MILSIRSRNSAASEFVQHPDRKIPPRPASCAAIRSAGPMSPYSHDSAVSSKTISQFEIPALPCENARVKAAYLAIPAALAATGFVAYAARYPYSRILGPVISHTDSPRKLAVTFDDGPNPAITPKLLDLLDRYNARATFFVIGQYVRQHPELLRETVARGHVIGNHTDSHPNLFWISAAQTRDELHRCQYAIATALNASPRFFRPPFGFRNPWLAAAARNLDLQVVTWSLITGDWHAPSSEWLIHRLGSISAHAESFKNANGAAMPSRGGDILCLHDGAHSSQNADRTRTLAALEECLPRWRDLGLDFVTMNEAVSTPAS